MQELYEDPEEFNSKSHAIDLRAEMQHMKRELREDIAALRRQSCGVRAAPGRDARAAQGPGRANRRHPHVLKPRVQSLAPEA
jgi:hypothetical protein